jgi:hypothetical protein
MTTRIQSPLPHRAPRRAARVALWLAWAALLAAPLFAVVPTAAAMPAAGHCEHAGATHHDGARCAELHAIDCAAPQDAHAGGPGPAPVARAARVLLLPAVADPPGIARGDAKPGARSATGPPLAIRYCTLRN